MSKVFRAQQHLWVLEQEIARYAESRPYEARTQFNEKTGTQHFTFHLTKHPPPIISILIGDVLQNLRPSLDHLASELVRYGRGQVYGKPTFPILRKPPTDGQRKAAIADPDNPGVSPAVLSAMKGAPDAALTIVESLQPYRATQGDLVLAPSVWPYRPPHRDRPRWSRSDLDVGGRHPLAVLRDLANIDKHGQVHITAGFLRRTGLSWTVAGVSGSSHYFDDSPVHDGAEVYSYIVTGGWEGQVNMDLGGAVDVTIEEPEALGATVPVTALFEQLIDFVWSQVFCRLTPLIS